MLNECLVDRGASPNMVNLEAYIDGHHITTVQASSLCEYHVALSLFRCEVLASIPNSTGWNTVLKSNTAAHGIYLNTKRSTPPAVCAPPHDLFHLSGSGRCLEAGHHLPVGPWCT